VSAVEAQLDALTQQFAALTSQLADVANRTTTLEELTQGQFDIDVDCANGETIGGALTQTANHLGIVVMTISGTCTENVTVARRHITVIRADPPGAEIVAANLNQPVIRLVNPGLGATYLGLSVVTIRGATNAPGVLADNGTTVQLSGATVTNNAQGIQASHHSLVRLENSFVENNGLGALIQSGAHVVVRGGAIRDNADFGLQLVGGAVADVQNAAIDSNDGGSPGASTIRGAIGLYGGSMLRLGNSTVSNNVGNGIFVVDGSVLWLDDTVTIDDNGGHGISLSDASVAGKLFVTAGAITNNGGFGVACSAPIELAQLYGFPPVGGGAINLTGNGSGPTNCATAAVPGP
jgi:hypothetical protein